MLEKWDWIRPIVLMFTGWAALGGVVTGVVFRDFDADAGYFVAFLFMVAFLLDPKSEER